MAVGGVAEHLSEARDLFIFEEDKLGEPARGGQVLCDGERAFDVAEADEAGDARLEPLDAVAGEVGVLDFRVGRASGGGEREEPRGFAFGFGHDGVVEHHQVGLVDDHVVVLAELRLEVLPRDEHDPPDLTREDFGELLVGFVVHAQEQVTGEDDREALLRFDFVAKRDDCGDDPRLALAGRHAEHHLLSWLLVQG